MKDEFLGLVCPFSMPLAIVFGLNVLYLLAAAWSLLVLEPGHGSYGVALLTVAISVVAILITSPLLYLCRQYNRV